MGIHLQEIIRYYLCLVDDRSVDRAMTMLHTAVGPRNMGIWLLVMASGLEI